MKISLQKFPWFPGFRICPMTNNKNPEMPEITRKLFKSKEHPVLMVNRYQKTAQKQSLCYLTTSLALIAKKLLSSFNGKFSLITLSNTLRVKSWSQKCLEKFFKQINSLNTSKIELIEIFRGFWVFEYALWQKTKTRKCRKSTESFLNQKAPSVNG